MPALRLRLRRLRPAVRGRPRRPRRRSRRPARSAAGARSARRSARRPSTTRDRAGPRRNAARPRPRGRPSRRAEQRVERGGRLEGAAADPSEAGRDPPRRRRAPRRPRRRRPRPGPPAPRTERRWPAPTDWITLGEAAEILAAANVHFTPATIGGWARAGRLQSIKLGGRRFVRRGEVRALVGGPATRPGRGHPARPVRGLRQLTPDWQTRALALLGRFLDRPQVARIRAVLDIYGAAAGGLLANGLAFSALFASIPTTLADRRRGRLARPTTRPSGQPWPMLLEHDLPAAGGPDRRVADGPVARRGVHLDPRHPRSRLDRQPAVRRAGRGVRSDLLDGPRTRHRQPDGAGAARRRHPGRGHRRVRS